jgi:chromosome condensin MukBEF MukE localization factor
MRASGPEKEAAALRARLSELQASLQRLQRLAMDPSIGEELLRVQMAELGSELRSTQGRLEVLKKRAAHVTEATVALQAGIDPLPLIERLLEGEPEAYKVRATLRRLIKRFVLVARKGKHTSVFELEFMPGICVAELSDSDVIDESPVTFLVAVSCTAKRPVEWHVDGRRLEN